MDVECILLEGSEEKKPFRQPSPWGVFYAPKNQSGKSTSRTPIDKSQLWGLLRSTFSPSILDLSTRIAKLQALGIKVQNNYIGEEDNQDLLLGTASDSLMGEYQFVRSLYRTNTPSILVINDNSILGGSTSEYRGIFIARDVPNEELEIFD